jgi:hypothetical protein
MTAAGAPIFYDPSGRRRRRFALGVAAFIALLLLSAVVFGASIGVVPSQPLLPINTERPLHRLAIRAAGRACARCRSGWRRVGLRRLGLLELPLFHT